MWISSIWNGFGKAWKHQVLHTKLQNLHLQGWAGIMYVNIFYLKSFGKAWKHNVLHTKLENLHWQGWAIMYVNIFYLKWLWEGMKTPSFAHKIGESALAGVGRNNICPPLPEYLLFEMALAKALKHQVLHTKSENLPWQGWAGIIYVNIFYLKWLWEGMKTPSFAHEIGESALGVGRNNVCEYLLFARKSNNVLHKIGECNVWISSIWNGFEKLWKGMKTQSFAHKIGESAGRGGQDNICEYLLFEMALGRHENTKFCTRNWRICPLAGVGKE